ncbi:lactoylglutathione lyase [Sphingomonas spermidinifaciens]|uniref:Lactoylglutathione lyase n=1 Tax=Sphingomonas spermidinifaciens TaxID=1141889 RepID=A0A2A4B5T1_9SPHN|nr:VOC family protein [Sphingomonas spermidinifaciens]PCD04553.1 lactoylglutathione lyase [Sphingomonas spermidinifaciens]
MARMIFVNLPVEDVARATAFYQAVGFARNEQFSNAQGSAMQWSDTIHVMLLARDLYATFTTKKIIDPRTESGALLALSFDDRAAVDAITEAALAAGGRELHEPEDHGFMYSRAFEDPDGNGWGPFTMDVAAHAAAMAAQPA